MRQISNLDIKLRLVDEFINKGGLNTIWDPSLLEGLMAVRIDKDGKGIADTVSPSVNAFMLALLNSHLHPILHSPNNIFQYESFIQKSIFFEQENIETVAQFDRIYQEYKAKLNLLCRGQKEAKWKLYSSLQREWILQHLDDNESLNYQSLIEKLVSTGNNTYQEQLVQLLNSHGIKNQNDISVLGFLQHHGCPTPMLDWTFNFSVAVYFAIDGVSEDEVRDKEIDDYCSVYFINEEDMATGSMRKMLKEAVQSEIGKNKQFKAIERIARSEQEAIELKANFEKWILGEGYVPHITAIKHMMHIPLIYFSDNDVNADLIFSLNNNQNIQNQQGVFTWNAEGSKPLEVVGQEQYQAAKSDDEPNEYRFCYCFNINKKLSKAIQEKLIGDGITREFIYPSMHNDARRIFEMSLSPKL